jgi:hypothetical protein
MSLSIGMFNLNNLFSRFDFTADLSAADSATTAVEEQTTFRFFDPRGFKLRTYEGRLVKGKPAAERANLVERIRRIDVDVLVCKRSRTSTRCARSSETTSRGSTGTSCWWRATTRV